MKERDIFSIWIAPHNGGYAYYGNAWSNGVPITAEERELYLSGNYHGFLHAISGREATAPRRPYWPLLMASFGRLSAGYGLLSLGFGAVAIKGAASSTDIVVARIQAIAAIFMVLFCILWLASRLHNYWRRRMKVD